jgi:Fic family protein
VRPNPPWFTDSGDNPKTNPPQTDPSSQMPPQQPQIPEPLQRFDNLESTLSTALSRVDGLLAEYQTRQKTGRILPNSIEAIRVELTYNSNAIEGSTLTLRETQLVLEGVTPGGKPIREIYEARNLDRALRLIEDWAANRPDAPISERDLLDIHAIVLADIDAAAAGRFRIDRVLIKGTRFIPPGHHKFDQLIPALLDLANGKRTHPVLTAAELHYNLAAVHPFADGNGRTARLLMNLHLLRSGYGYTVIEVSRRADYLAALEEANAGRCEPFAKFIIESTEHTLNRLLGLPPL